MQVDQTQMINFEYFKYSFFIYFRIHIIIKTQIKKNDKKIKMNQIFLSFSQFLIN